MDTNSKQSSYRWSVCLRSESPEKATILLVFIICAFLAGWLVVNSLLVGIIGSLLIIFSTIEYWAPIHFSVDPEGAESRCVWQWQKIAWHNVKRVSLVKKGILLSPFSTPSKLDNFRGVFLRTEQNSDEVMQAISSWRSHEYLG